MSAYRKECNRLDVLDLTSDLREAEDWIDLREAICEKGLSLNKLAMPLFVEDEYGNEYGLLVAAQSVYEFRFNGNLKVFEKWNESDEPEGEYASNHKEVEWTREILQSGDI